MADRTLIRKTSVTSHHQSKTKINLRISCDLHRLPSRTLNPTFTLDPKNPTTNFRAATQSFNKNKMDHYRRVHGHGPNITAEAEPHSHTVRYQNCNHVEHGAVLRPDRFGRCICLDPYPTVYSPGQIRDEPGWCKTCQRRTRDNARQ